MSSSSIPFHKIWIEQREATAAIRERLGLNNALDYLIGEKLFHFVQASEQHPEFAAELPEFLAEIRRLFSSDEIGDYLNHRSERSSLRHRTPIWKWMAWTTKLTKILGRKPRPRGRGATALLPYPATPSAIAAAVLHHWVAREYSGIRRLR